MGSDEEIDAEKAIRARLGRQKRLTPAKPGEPGSPPIEVEAYIDEGVLRRLVGGPKVMTDQLHHLLWLAELLNIRISAVPDEAGAWGTMTGSAIILGFDDPDDPGTVYLEHAAGGESVENEADVAAFVGLFEDVAAAVALSSKDTTKMIRAALKTLEGR